MFLELEVCQRGPDSQLRVTDQEMGPCEISCVRVGMLTYIVIFARFVQETIFLKFCGCIYPVSPKEHYLATDIPGLKFLKICPPSLL